MLHEQIKKELVVAMKAKEATKLSVIRALLTAFTNELVAKKRAPSDFLNDEEALAVITRASKQRKDSIKQFEDGGRPELAVSEKEELAIIETYLPELMNEDEVRKVVEAKIAELGINGKSDAGKLMGAIMGDLKGKADGTVVKNVVEELLS